MKTLNQIIAKNHYKDFVIEKINEIIDKNDYINQYVEPFYSFDKTVFYDLNFDNRLTYILSTQTRNESYFLNNIKDLHNYKLTDFVVLNNKKDFVELIDKYNKKLSEHRILDRLIIYLNSKDNTFLDKKDKIYAEFKRFEGNVNYELLESFQRLNNKRFVFIKNSYEAILKNLDLGDLVYIDISDMKQSDIKKLDEIISVLANLGIKFVLFNKNDDECMNFMANYTYFESFEDLHKSKKHCIIVYDY